MKKLFGLTALIGALLLASCTSPPSSGTSVSSPNGRVELQFDLVDGYPRYTVRYDGETSVEQSQLGIVLQEDEDLVAGFEVRSVTSGGENTTWQPVWGTASEIVDHFSSTIVELQEKGGAKRQLSLEFRAYDDGIAFRYLIPEQPELADTVINDEYTTFNFAGDLEAYIGVMREDGWGKSQQVEYPKTTVGGFPEEKRATFPALVRTGPGWAAVTEAAVVDYADALIERPQGSETGFQIRLNRAPGTERSEVPVVLPMKTPWRVVLLAEHPGMFLESNLIANLNEPVALGDTSWIKPDKALWPWWNGRLPFGEPSTEQMKAYIDFCAEQGIGSIVVDAGWYSLEADAWDDPNGEDVFTMEETRADNYDIREVIDYGNSKDIGVHLWVHGATLHRQMDEILPAFAEWGVVGIKADSWYGGDRGDYDSVQYFHDLLKKSAEHRIMLNHHGWYKPTGVSRTYPHLLTREAVLGLEHAKWSDKPTIEHNVMLAYTRGILGQMDYTPGAFDLKGTEDEPKEVQGTRTAQLAMYVVYFSPFQMLPDSPEVYGANLDDFKFLVDVPTVWDETRFLSGEVGDYVVVARRRGEEWYLGALNGESTRSISVPLDFLGDGEYVAEIYQDAEDAAQNPESIDRTNERVDREGTLTAPLAIGGGYAVRFTRSTSSAD